MNLTILWIIAGVILCILELISPSVLVELMMGISALIVAAVSLIIPNVTAQMALWLILSTALVILSRRIFTPKRKISYLADAEYGETLTSISPGEAGRVLYEGNSWRALCADETMSISKKEKVYILRREGTTLIVASNDLFKP